MVRAAEGPAAGRGRGWGRQGAWSRPPRTTPAREASTSRRGSWDHPLTHAARPPALRPRPPRPAPSGRESRGPLLAPLAPRAADVERYHAGDLGAGDGGHQDYNDDDDGGSGDGERRPLTVSRVAGPHVTLPLHSTSAPGPVDRPLPRRRRAT